MNNTYAVMTRIILALSALLFAPQTYAHYSIDFSFNKIWMDKECHINMEIKNYSDHLPHSFYNRKNSARIEISKGHINETLNSLAELDEKRLLAKTNGTLQLRSKKSYIGITAPLTVKLITKEGFINTQPSNNNKVISMDCKLGKGQIPGDKIIATEPDISISNARLKLNTCTLHFTMKNLNTVALPDKAWEGLSGVILMQKNLHSNIREQDIPLSQLDPKRHFTRKAQIQQIKIPIPSGIESLRIGVWQVPGDTNFGNNHIDIAIPQNATESCI